MNLDHLYSLRRDFTVIGLTGRTGSGCTRISDILAGSFENLENTGLRDPNTFSDTVFQKKYSICKNFLKHPDNWVPFEKIRYVDVLLFFILYKIGGNAPRTKELLIRFFKEESDEQNDEIVEKILANIKSVHEKHAELIAEMRTLETFPEIRDLDQLSKLHDLFFGSAFRDFVVDLLNVLENQGYLRTRTMLHWVASNIRSTGDPLRGAAVSVDHIYSIAELINSIIKAKRNFNKGQRPTKIVIDSLRNSLEIMFFRQRFAAFYMVATKDVLGNAKKRLLGRFRSKISDESERSRVVDELMKLDDIEYKTKDFSKGNFTTPDVENCIQKSDYHILNLKLEDVEKLDIKEKNRFATREEQLMKLVALIQHPGLITPSSAERVMQIANTARLNSGCISRKVGAVITDDNYFVKAIGWNDVAKGQTPCNLRSVSDFLDGNNLDSNPHYTEFEKGNVSPNCSYKYKDDVPSTFKDAMIEYYSNAYSAKKNDLQGKNCSFCFKTIHNHYEGEANQVHTRSLHAEENAMLQLTKLGGIGVKGGFLFTTASPCELCSKKAYQLGITKVYYIDPYPGIAVDQILRGGSEETRPILIPFSGAIGNAYDWLYESFMAYKEELSMTLELKPKQKLSKEIGNVLKNANDKEINDFLAATKLNDDDVLKLVKATIATYNSQQAEKS